MTEVIKQFPHPDQLLSTIDLVKYTGLSRRFWEGRRFSGDSPPYLSISNRSVRYRWGDVWDWLQQKTRNNAAQQ